MPHNLASSCLENRGNSIEFSFFSDCFAISATPAHAASVCGVAAWACNTLLRNGFLFRGGMVLGDLRHTSQVIFGPALVRAVEIEQARIPPFIVCDVSAVSLCTSLDASLLLDAPDGNLVLNVATGSALALAELDGVLAENQSRYEKYAAKWKQVRELLPIMYRAKESL